MILYRYSSAYNSQITTNKEEKVNRGTLYGFPLVGGIPEGRLKGGKREEGLAPRLHQQKNRFIIILSSMQTKNTKCNLYSPKLILYAQHNRRQDTMTQTEGLVWNCILKGRKMLGYKFLRQKPILFFIIDFYCVTLRLGIEIDGGYHNEPAQAEYDEKRTKILEAEKILLIRIKNEEVLSNLEGVLHYIEEKVQARAIELGK